MSYPVTAPNRRWFRWSLRTLFVVMTVAAAIAWGLRGYWKQLDPDEFVFTATVVDPPTANAVVRLLNGNGIESGSEGTIVGRYGILGTEYRISCRRRDAPRACELLRKAQPAFDKKLWYIWKY